ncbi:MULTISPECIES: LysR substrate-binding domain-containing protein [Cupriavidus]|uniref:LysR family transcriptional regulator n=1 Tax=Cupriavidus pauculus TaxID=82633 RepID=A0A3G8H9C3_9BURK|nr:LysR substrate-binding domain-containing protein [Cupriavidus pauculus]AZG17177.1 LysR family transcriptional regulator [Cupriavidus pauculus]
MKSTNGRHLPALANLIAFETTARTGSVTGAAEELCLTQSAVSKQITELESFLGARMLNRRKGAVAPTPAGEEYLKSVRKALAMLEEATMEVQSGRASGGRLNLSVPVSLGNIWLLPRMLRFAREQPHIQLNVTTKVGPVDLESAGLDAAIMYCAGPPPRHFSLKVMPLELYPVCARELMPAGTPLAKAVRILPLLHQNAALEAWPAYLQQTGIKLAHPHDGSRYGLLTMGLQAALGGLGLALLPEYVAGDDIKAGRLLRLSDEPYVSPKAYYFICREDKRDSPAMETFIAWLLEQSAEANRR